MDHFETALELKFVAETGAFEGYACVFGVVDRAGDRIAAGAFAKSLKEWRRAGRMPPLLWQHDTKQPIGAWNVLTEDSYGLYAEGQLFTGEIARAREAYKLLQENVVTGLSIGYRTKESHAEGGVRVLDEVELLEISMVTFPANERARISRVKSALVDGGVPSPREFEAFLREAGFSRKQARGLLALGYKSLSSLPCDAEEEERLNAHSLALLREVTQTLEKRKQP
jgi:HK97 family phage prohead protease